MKITIKTTFLSQSFREYNANICDSSVNNSLNYILMNSVSHKVILMIFLWLN